MNCGDNRPPSGISVDKIEENMDTAVDYLKVSNGNSSAMPNPCKLPDLCPLLIS